MTDIIEKSIVAGNLPPELRGDFSPDAQVLVSVHELTENGFTKLFEDHILAADQKGYGPAMEADEAIATLQKIADENKVR